MPWSYAACALCNSEANFWSTSLAQGAFEQMKAIAHRDNEEIHFL
jgi:hypothetical protein